MFSRRGINTMISQLPLKVFVSVILSLTVHHMVLSEQQVKQTPSEEKPVSLNLESHEYRTDCSTLMPGQYLCLDLNIDPLTQQPKDCNPVVHRANVTCEAAPGIICHSTGNTTFTGTVPCK